MTSFVSEKSIVLLDEFSPNDIKEWKKRHESFFDHYWSEYSYYANERSKRASKIRESLPSVSKPCDFNEWFRVITLRYNNNPLSAAGSRLHPIGGRYNFGNIDAAKFPCFSALYVASNHDTAMAEKFSCLKEDSDGFDQVEQPGIKISYTAIRVRGKLDSVIDVTNRDNLKPFVNIIKKIKNPSHLEKSARKLKLEPPQNIRTPSQLQTALQYNKWGATPSLFDIPSSPQIFGHIVYSANIQGILYQSKYTGDQCLAIFPENFKEQTGYVELSDIPT